MPKLHKSRQITFTTMNTIDDGGPAFPCQPKNGQGYPCGEMLPGMSLRDWFAGMALQGLLTQRQETGDHEPSGQVSEGDAGIVYRGAYIAAVHPNNSGDEYEAASDAYAFADAMLAARAASEPS